MHHAACVKFKSTSPARGSCTHRVQPHPPVVPTRISPVSGAARPRPLPVSPGGTTQLISMAWETGSSFQARGLLAAVTTGAHSHWVRSALHSCCLNNA